MRHGLWEGRYDGPVFGRIPQEWRGLYSFTFVRHPLDRAVSAFADFVQLRGFRGTVGDFVDVIIDDSIPYSDVNGASSEAVRKNKSEIAIRHHTIPQTHPFNCLKEASFVGRFENYRDDLETILQTVGLVSADIPKLRETDHYGFANHLSHKEIARLTEFYFEDFQLLGYETP